MNVMSDMYHFSKFSIILCAEFNLKICNLHFCSYHLCKRKGSWSFSLCLVINVVYYPSRRRVLEFGSFFFFFLINYHIISPLILCTWGRQSSV